MRSRLGRLAAAFGMVVTAALVVPTAGAHVVGLVSGSTATGIQQSTNVSAAGKEIVKKKKKKPCTPSPNSPTTTPGRC